MHLRPWGVLALFALIFGLAPALRAQTFDITFQKLSDTDDSIDDVNTGFPPSRDCPIPCTTAHFVFYIANCAMVGADGACMGTNPGPVTGGAFSDALPVTLPVDCARGVTVTGAGTWDPPVCDAAANTVTMGNVTIPPGGTIKLSFWAAVDCDAGLLQNFAFFQYDQNPLGMTAKGAHDPVSFFGRNGLVFRIGNVATAEATKDAPALPIMGPPQRRIGQHGQTTSWVIDGGNPNCEPLVITDFWDTTNPTGCLTVNCATVRMFINGIPSPLPAGFLCPDTVRPAAFTIGSLTLQPHDTLRVTYDATFTSDTGVEQCCNVGAIKITGVPLVTTSDPQLDNMLMPEYTCAYLGAAVGSALDAIKAAEDAAGNEITTVRPGDDIFWHFTVTNTGGNALNFDLSDSFPASARLSPTSIITPFPTGTCSITGQNLTCTGVSLPDGSSIEMRVRSTLDCTGLQGGDRICNAATLNVMGFPMPVPTHCPTCGGTPPNNQACVTLEAPAFEFASKTATDASGNGQVATGEVVTYQITALNSGTTSATGVIVRDPIPAGTVYVPGSLRLDGALLTDGADADAGEVAAGTVVVRLGTIGVLAFGTGVVTFDVTLQTPMGAQLCNDNATLEWTEGPLCGLPPHAIPPACLDYEGVVSAPQLSAVKSVLPVGAVDPLAVLQYSIGVCNGAMAAAATGVTLVDDIPAQTTYRAGSLALDGGPLTDAADADAGAFQAGPTPRISVLVGALAPGACKTVTFGVDVAAAAAGSVSNLATVSADSVPSFDSNGVTNTITSVNPPQLSLTKTSAVSGGPPATVGGRITYAFQACNAAGAGAAANVVITDAVPSDVATGCGALYVVGSITVNGLVQTDVGDGDFARFEPAPAPGGVVVTIPTLLAGECVDVTFDVLVAAGCDDGEAVSNTATVVADGTASVASNATSDVVSVIVPPVPSLLRKEGGPLANRCPNPPSLCGCEVGLRLDPVADDCVVAGTCSQVNVTTWTVPGELQRRRTLVFYELFGAGCLRAGDPTRLAVSKALPDDITVSLVP